MPEARWPLSPDAVGWPVRKTAGGVLYGDGRVILALRRADRAYYPGVWNIVGGHARDSEILRTLSIGSCAANMGVVPVHCREIGVFRRRTPQGRRSRSGNKAVQVALRMGEDVGWTSSKYLL